MAWQTKLLIEVVKACRAIESRCLRAIAGRQRVKVPSPPSAGGQVIVCGDGEFATTLAKALGGPPEQRAELAGQVGKLFVAKWCVRPATRSAQCRRPALFQTD